MASMLIGVGGAVAIMCVLWLYGISFTKGWQFALAAILIPFTLVLLLGDEQGQKAWGGIVLGIIAVVVGISMS